MQYWLLAISLIFTASLVLAQAQEYLPGLLATDVPQLSDFFALLNSSQDLYTHVKWGGVTVLAPTNDALAAANLRQSNYTTQQRLDALLHYHILDGIHPGVSLGNDATSYSTLLEGNPDYTNRTGGQVVEVVLNDTAINFISGALATSTVVKADVLFEIGVLHCIDAVLDVPFQVAQAVIASNMSSFLALAEKGKLASDEFNSFLADVQDSPDTTIFAPNSPAYGYNFTGWDDYSAAQDLAIWKYHWLNGTILQTSNITNGSKYMTAAGLNITTWVIGDDIYINDAKILQRDVLQANGLIQTLDKPLDPNNATARPNFQVLGATKAQTGLTTAAQAGIAVAAGSVALLSVTLATLYCVKRRRRRAQHVEFIPATLAHKLSDVSMEQTELGGASMYELSSARQIHELSPIETILEMQGWERTYVRDAYAGKVFELEVVEQQHEFE